MDSKTFSVQTFKNPPAALRGAPFWAWNCELNKEELLKQLNYFKEMGFGGFHIHVRSGLSVPYLGDEFFSLVEDCVNESEKLGLIPRLYDEDRWPSGFAGGLVTKYHPEYRKRWLRVTPEKDRNGTLIACYDVILNSDGTLQSYRLTEDSAPVGNADRWYAYLEIMQDNPRFNNAAYVDTLNKKAILEFINVTYESFFKRFGDRFGTVIPSIFTDEPQHVRYQPLPFSNSKTAAILPWTDDLPQTFTSAYGENLLAHLPQLIWNLPEDAPSQIRYHYHDHITERFVSAYSDTVGNWCDNHNILFTGHVLSESPLGIEAVDVGDAMRFYRGMSLPGMDMLCGYHEFTTAKQLQSSVRQYGRSGMMSELYGVLGWDLDFRGHKHHGDWQAALGVTLRVPHLSWVSMKGEAKRDYPQSIFYQSPWYKLYPYLEDHFARVNLALTQGTPVCRIAVIHPMESMWLCLGASDRNAADYHRLQEDFANLTRWLLSGNTDFDFLCEAELQTLCRKGGNPLQVGKCSYRAIVVPNCKTLRTSTYQRLKTFCEQGGTLIFMGNPPTCLDSVPSPLPMELAQRSVCIPYSETDILSVLNPFRDVTLQNTDGSPAKDWIYQLRQTESERFCFFAKAVEPENKDIPVGREIRISFRGTFSPEELDTLSGEIRSIPAEHLNGETVFTHVFYEQDSLLLRLVPCAETADGASRSKRCESTSAPVPIPIPSVNAFVLGEPNVLLLDTAQASLDGGTWQPEEEILRIDNLCREKLGWQLSGGGAAQPWCVEKEETAHRISLRFTVNSTIALPSVSLALEHPKNTSVLWNGESVSNTPTGFFTDHDIHTLPLPGLLKGTNTLVLTFPYEKRVPLEWCYLLGNFGVIVSGCEKTVVPLASKLGFGNIVPQTLPFYSGTLTYRIPFSVPKSGTVSVQVPQYRAAVLECCVDGGKKQILAYSPYIITFSDLSAGDHLLEITAYLNRTNAFHPLHNTNRTEIWLGPNLWRTTGEKWCYEYECMEEGILHSPKLNFLECSLEKMTEITLP